MGNILQINYLIIIVFNFFLIGLVLLSVKHSEKTLRAKVFFIWLVVFINLWLGSILVLSLSTQQEIVDLFGRTAFLAPTMIMLFLFLFSLNFPRRSNDFKTLSRIIYIVSGSFAALSMTNLVVNKVVIISGQATPVYGSFYGFYGIAILACLFASFYPLIVNYRNSSPNQRTQLKIFITGFGVSVVLALITNLVIPGLSGNRTTSVFGPYGIVFFLSAVVLSIIRHRFLDIRVLVGRLVYYFLLSILPFSVFFILVYFYDSAFGGVFVTPVYLLSLPVAIAFVMLFNYINNVLRNEVTSRLINPGYNPAETTERLSNDLSVMIELTPITKAILETLSKTIRPDFASIVILPDEKHSTNRVYSSQEKQTIDFSKLISAVTTMWTTVGKHPILLEDIEIEISEGLYKNVPFIAQEIEKQMKELGVRVIFALGQEETFGVFLVGQKEADSIYSRSDVDFLKSVANTGALAIQRSLLYNEVQEFAQTLQKRVDDATGELKQANTELQSALVQLQEARRVERDMIDVMGHELRTPITIVRNALVMLHKQNSSNDEKRSDLEKYLDMALESTRREITLIETLLSATKIDNARIQLYLTKADMVDMVDDALEGQKVPMAQKNLEIKFNRPAEPIWVYADRTRAQEIIDNFLSNAIKYTLQGKVEVNVWQDDKYVYTSIKDTGIGISEEDLKNLGKKFFRAKQHIPKRDGKVAEVIRPGGTGLGLYVTFDLIRVMGGQLYINSKVGEGTTFTYSLPLYTDQPEKQVDQTFDNKDAEDSTVVFLNQQAPQPPGGSDK